MGFLDFFKGTDINQSVKEYQQTQGAVLLDVRTQQEYQAGHIPGSRNLPLHHLDRMEQSGDNQDKPIYVYCQSGARSAQAAARLKQMGYTRVKNIGGIAGYAGKVER